ncbi:MAG: PH domain-containing protein [Halobacteriales archaeon]
MSWLGALFTWRGILTLGLWAIVIRYGSRYTVTNERVYRRFGILSRDEVFLRIDEVRDVALNQRFAERVLRFGTLRISSAGRAGTEIEFRRVGNPARVRDEIEKARSEQAVEKED